MNDDIIINPETLGFISFLNQRLFARSNFMSHEWPYSNLNVNGISLEEVRFNLKRIDQFLRDNEYREDSEVPLVQNASVIGIG